MSERYRERGLGYPLSVNRYLWGEPYIVDGTAWKVQGLGYPLSVIRADREGVHMSQPPDAPIPVLRDNG